MKNIRVVLFSLGLLLLGMYFFIFFLRTLKSRDFALKVLGRGESVGYTVKLKEDGFHPKELVIWAGEKVTFISLLDNFFWPASNPHPTHEIYQEFDPKRPLEHGEKWTFRFDNAGRWKYHNHIHPNHRGTITVLPGKEKSITSVKATANCLEVSSWAKVPCWEEQLEITLYTKGLEAAFELFADLYKTEPDIPKACHGWGHVLGEAAYTLYAKDQNVELGRETSYCGYGFYHGFLEKFIQDKGADIKKMRGICDSLKKSLRDKLFSISRNCIHGVGHGTTAWLLEDSSNWGNFQKVADKGLHVCEEIFRGTELRDCYDGVFNELYLDVLNSDYNFSFADFKAKGDPFWYCRQQKERYKESCYFEFIGLFYLFFDYDVMEATRYAIKEIDNLKEYGDSTIGKLAADFIQFDIVKNNYIRNVEACRIVPSYLFSHCFFGIANGFIQHGEPENMHSKFLPFCEAEYLTMEEREMCYKYMFGLLRANYTAEKLDQVCQLLNERYRRMHCPSTHGNMN